jgi:uncharacterized coiled-coil protein SlyX
LQNARCQLYEWNDPEISNSFQKKTVLKLKDKVMSLQNQVSSLEAQVAQMDDLVRWKDNNLAKLLKEVDEKDRLLRGMHDKLEEVKEEEVKKICYFPMSLVLFAFVIFVACWCYQVSK